MQVDYFKDILVPVIGGLGIFMLGLEFMSNGIQSLAVSRMRALLARIAGTPVKGVIAGTVITGVIQSSTAMTVMVVGLVNSGVLALRPAISVIMGANIGTTLGNGLIALPLGPLGLLLGGFFALIYVFAKSDRLKNGALACMGFALIFYGLNLMTGGLRPIRNIPEVMAVISSLNADSLLGVLVCVLTAAVDHRGDPFVVGDHRHRHGARRRRRPRLADGGGLFARRRPRHDDHLVDRLAQPVEERQAGGLRPYRVQHHRRHGDAAAVLPGHAAPDLGDGLVRR